MSDASKPVKVRNLIESHMCGPSPTCEERQISDDKEWGILKTTAVVWQGWNPDAHKVPPKFYWGKRNIEVKQGDILVTKAGPRGRVGVVVYVDETPPRLMVSGKMIGLRPNQNEVNGRYLAALLSSEKCQRYLDARTTGMAESQLNFSNELLLDLEIQPADPEHQKKIAAILETVDEAIEATEALIGKYEQVKAGMMQDLFTRGLGPDGKLRPPRHEAPDLYQNTPIGWIPKDWEVKSLGEACDWFSGGTPSKSNEEWWRGDVPWLSPKDMKSFEMSDTSGHVTRLAAATGSRVMPANTVFIVIRGMILAHTFPVVLSRKEMCFNQDIKAVLGLGELDNRFLAYWFRSKSEIILRIATEATHGTKRFDMKDIYALPIGLPNSKEQAEITKIVDLAERNILLRAEELQKLRQQKAGLMADLLTGKVPVTV